MEEIAEETPEGNSTNTEAKLPPESTPKANMEILILKTSDLEVSLEANNAFPESILSPEAQTHLAATLSETTVSTETGLSTEASSFSEPLSIGPCLKKKRDLLSFKEIEELLNKQPEILKFIVSLRKTLDKKEHIIEKLKQKIKKLKSKHKKAVLKSLEKTDGNNAEKPNPTKEGAGWSTSADGKQLSIAEQVAEVAQSAMAQSGMVYVESAGMYYDYNTGYYYNSELGLYYHPSTGCYYGYSADKKEFTYHSHADMSALAQTHKPQVPAVSLPAQTQELLRKKDKLRKQKKDKEETGGEGSKKGNNVAEGIKQRDGRGEHETDKKRKNRNKDDTDRENEKDSTNAKADERENRHVEETAVQNGAAPAKRKKIKNRNAADERGEGKVVDPNEDLGADCGEEVRDAKKKMEVEEKADVEDGECSDTASEGGHMDGADSDSTTTDVDESVSKHHAPCMRVVVRETNLPKLRVGTLFLVTKDGGTLGREGDSHAVLIRDENVSRIHLQFVYNEEKRRYDAIDLGSKNGTILNGSRMSDSQQVSQPIEVVHGSYIQVGETKLLCHIHPGTDTCGHCEPGLIMAADDSEKRAAYTRTCDVKKQHALELARLKNRYAPEPLAIEDGSYKDRAKQRREQVGSSHHSEKTVQNDLDTSIAQDNKGFQMMEKMGWKTGEGLGKEQQGETEPVPLVSNAGKAGLGAGGTTAPAIPAAGVRLRTRTKPLRPPASAFRDPLEEDD